MRRLLFFWRDVSALGHRDLQHYHYTDSNDTSLQETTCRALQSDKKTRIAIERELEAQALLQSEEATPRSESELQLNRRQLVDFSAVLCAFLRHMEMVFSMIERGLGNVYVGLAVGWRQVEMVELLMPSYAKIAHM